MTSASFASAAYAAAQNRSNSPLALGHPAGAAPGLGDFAAFLEGAVTNTASAGRAADQAMMQSASGKGDLVDVVTAVAESEAALETLVAVRDRVIAAYEDIMRMPI